MIFILLLPGILSGWKSGICRASLISLFRMADRPLMRRRDAYNTLFFVGSLLLLFNAFALYDTGFWMSLMTAAAVSFQATVIDANGPSRVWGKGAGDLNGDGRTDLVVGSYDGGLYWYENPGWTKRTISATARIEELMEELRQQYTLIIVTHSMQQAARVSQKTAFFHLGKLIEFGDTEQIFTAPKNEKTQGYITGRFG